MVSLPAPTETAAGGYSSDEDSDGDITVPPKQVTVYSELVEGMLQGDVVDTTSLSHKLLMHAYMVDLFMGGGITSSISEKHVALVALQSENGESDIDYITRRLRDFKITSHPVISPPPMHIPIITSDNIDKAYVDIILAQLCPATEKGFREYLKDSFLGILSILGPAFAGTTQTLSLATLLYLERFGKSYGMANSNVATTNFALRTYELGTTVTHKYREANPESTRNIPLVVRGYEAQIEAVCVMHIISNDETSTSVTYKWRQTGTIRSSISLSLAEWFLKVVQFADWDLNELDHPVLFQLRDDLKSDDAYGELREFITLKIAKTNLRKKLIRQITAIQECTVKAAQFICTTSHCAARKPYKNLHKTARAVMIDEAGAMPLAEASMAIGQYLRPLIIAGDEQQVKPTVRLTT
ncbi:uncharacterized protein B0J16DRAFT_327869 [Fusarium flagelliforme]|uniref:DNA helicase n=1 Tax=Fusarium flagelliforme TaxID=2675880 RepID=A0A395MWH4_9HYPO|nr:uncharacterized protein B0J16DRAFT_327869 [Fusarium flagelliforme]KAH7197291.1 hypothetical protein B0J16DRAFT_327869 [Fusarium flagelliforme]RFN52266.1 DNA helicase [Fusarium flagelliforme]